MQKRFYLDTCIWRDYFENREDRLRPIGEWAFALIRQIIENEDLIIYSEIVNEELMQDYPAEKIHSLLEIVPHKLLIEVNASSEEVEKSISISRALKIPRNDVLHALIAKNKKAILVTRDAHFSLLQEMVTVKLPEELI